MSRSAVVAVILALAACPAASRAERPNIVLLLADDLGWGDVACFHAASKVPMPHLDRLAAQGIRMTDAHSSSGVCVPSRFSLLTGQHAFRLVNPPHPDAESRQRYGGNQATVPLIPADRPTLATILGKAGYATSMVGKWHLGFDDLLRRPTEPLRGGPLDRGFDRYFGIPSSLDFDPYVYIDGNRIVAQASVAMPAHASPGWPDPRMGEFWRGGVAAPGFQHAAVLPELTRRAEAELRRLAGEAKQRPFFFYYALPSPHSPLVPSKEYRGKTAIGIYGDYVAQTDDAIGRLLRVLDETNQAKQTIVIATSDNGPFWYPGNVEQTGHAAAGPWRGMKGDAWEGGHRMPFIARWPGQFPAGKTSDAPVSLTDLLMTLAALADAPTAGAATDGIDFSPALRGQAWTRPADHPLLAHSSLGALALRDGPWKLINQLGSGGFSKPTTEKPANDGPTVQLYDLSKDPGEKHNLAAQAPERVKQMQERLRLLRGAKP